MDFLAGVMAAVVAIKRELLTGLVSGVFCGLAMYICRPLLRWSASRSRNDVRRLLHSEIMQPISTYALMAVGYGCQIAGTLALIAPRATRDPLERWAIGLVVALLFIFGSVAIGLIATRAAKRLAKQVIELLASASVAT